MKASFVVLWLSVAVVSAYSADGRHRLLRATDNNKKNNKDKDKDKGPGGKPGGKPGTEPGTKTEAMPGAKPGTAPNPGPAPGPASGPAPGPTPGPSTAVPVAVPVGVSVDAPTFTATVTDCCSFTEALVELELACQAAIAKGRQLLALKGLSNSQQTFSCSMSDILTASLRDNVNDAQANYERFITQVQNLEYPGVDYKCFTNRQPEGFKYACEPSQVNLETMVLKSAPSIPIRYKYVCCPGSTVVANSNPAFTSGAVHNLPLSVNAKKIYPGMQAPDPVLAAESPDSIVDVFCHRNIPADATTAAGMSCFFG